MIREYYPTILSASRATDIPAFYSDWFKQCLTKGRFIKKNPFNGDIYSINIDKVRAIVFWTKNPEPFLNHISGVKKAVPNFYFQYTLNQYDTYTEQNLPKYEDRIKTFIRLSEMIGKEKIVWRFDPLLLSDKINVQLLINKVAETAEKLKDHTEKCVFSFVDIEKYRKVRHKIVQSKVKIREFTQDEKIEFAEGISELKNKFHIELATCAEETDLKQFGIQKNKCIDDQLLRKLFPEDQSLSTYLSDPKNLKDSGQRKHCGCIKSKDVGMYNTCLHSCVYCYATASKKAAVKNHGKIYANNT